LFIVGPLVAGAISQVLGWRWIFGTLGILGFSIWMVILLFLNETLRSLVGNGSSHANSIPIQRLCLQRKSKIEKSSSTASTPGKVASTTSILLASFQHFREKDAILPLLYYAIHFASLCCFVTSIPELYLRVYSLTSVQLGLVYVVHGAGCAIGNILGGKLLNFDFQTTVKKQGMSLSSCSRGNLDPSFPIEYARLRCIWIHVILLAGKWHNDRNKDYT
jgi:predicted MFS family arabinose efflux permease